MELRTIKLNDVSVDVYFVESGDELNFIAIETPSDATNIYPLLSGAALAKIESALRVDLNKPLTKTQFYKLYPHGTYGGHMARFNDLVNPTNYEFSKFSEAHFIATADDNRKAGYSND